MTDVEKPTVKFLGDRSRIKTVPLDWPVSFDGKEYHSITLRRLTTQQVADFIGVMSETVSTSGARVTRLPIFVDEDGTPVPVDVLDGLDDADMSRLEAAAVDFLPPRFRTSEAAIVPPTGGSTGP